MFVPQRSTVIQTCVKRTLALKSFLISSAKIIVQNFSVNLKKSKSLCLLQKHGNGKSLLIILIWMMIRDTSLTSGHTYSFRRLEQIMLFTSVDLPDFPFSEDSSVVVHLDTMGLCVRWM